MPDPADRAKAKEGASEAAPEAAPPKGKEGKARGGELAGCRERRSGKEDAANFTGLVLGCIETKFCK